MNNLNGIGDILTAIHQNLRSMNTVVNYHHSIIEKLKQNVDGVDVVNTAKKNSDLDELESRLKQYIDNKIPDNDVVVDKLKNYVDDKIPDSDVVNKIKLYVDDKLSDYKKEKSAIVHDDTFENKMSLAVKQAVIEANLQNQVSLEKTIMTEQTNKKPAKSRKKTTKKAQLTNDLSDEIEKDILANSESS